MNKIKIFVATHKAFDKIYQDEVYNPIHVGKKLSNTDLGYIGDNTGDNISEKNQYYSEMTAQYWAWKNVHKVEFIGFCHYRKYFETTFTEQNVEDIFKDGIDVVMAGPVVRNFGRLDFLKEFMSSEDIAIMLYVVKKKYPDYYQTVSEYAYGYKDYPMNMFVCRKSLFDEYAKWIFSILFECEKYIKLSPYSRARRIYGYIAEFLMPVYFIHNRCKIKCINYANENGTVRKDSARSFFKASVIKKLLFLGKKKPLLEIDAAVKLGLEKDLSINLDIL